MASYPIWLVTGNIGGREIYRAFLTEPQAKAYGGYMEESGGLSTLKIEEVTQYVG